MSAPTFADFFREVNGFEPFPWQVRLAERAAVGAWPSSINVPTGMGKTSVLDVAVYTLATQARFDRGSRTAATRTALVVDRRLVVDSAFAHGEHIARCLAQPTGAATAWVGQALRTLCPSSVVPLRVVRMRGGVTWASRWLESADQPALIIGTVDQFGSRLLFRGYGASDRMKPIDAALVGTDTLLLLDEAHLSAPLLDTIAAVQRIESTAPERVGRALTVVAMSATTRGARAGVLGISEEDKTSTAAPRLAATKLAILVELQGKAAKSVPQCFARCAEALVAAEGIDVIGVVVNTIGLARQIFDALPTSVDRELVIGRARPVDRTRNEGRWLPRTKVGRRGNAPSRPLVIVATQTIEVGVDLDFDGIVTQVAAIDALVQRFGRVDRVGVRGASTSIVLHVPGDDPVYGASALSTWNALSTTVSPTIIGDVKDLARIADERVGFEFNALSVAAWLEAQDLDMLMSAPAPSPLPTPATVACWRRTSPIPAPDEDVLAYLHGVGEWSPSVTVAWRCDIGDLGDEFDSARVAEVMDAIPLDAQEQVEVPLRVLRAFLGSSMDRVPDVADIDGVDPRTGQEPRCSRGALVRRADAWMVLGASSLKAGDIVVLPVGYGGHDEFGWSGDPTHVVRDVGGLVGSGARRIRLDTTFLRQFLGDTADGLPDAVMASEAPGSVMAKAIADAIEPSDDLVSLLAVIPEAVLQARHRGDEGVVLSADLVIPRGLTDLAAMSDGDDSTSLRTTTKLGPVTLHDHLNAVGARAFGQAQALGLPESLARSVGLAARLHDLGKADARFQTLLHLGNRFRAELARVDAAQALAKSGSGDRSTYRAIARQSEWPRGLRHEAISMAMVEEAASDLFAGADRDLVEHLVGSHHGYARPLFPPVVDVGESIVDVSFDGHPYHAVAPRYQSAPHHADQFDRLCSRYGTWGVALLEAIVRLSDIAVSEEGS